MFCIKCGKKATSENFCDDCFLQQRDLFTSGNISLILCKECDKYFGGQWLYYKDEKELVKELIAKKIITKNRIKKKEIFLRPSGGGYIAKIKCTGFISPCMKEKTEERTARIIIKKIKCDECVKLSGKYYEAVFQIRGANQERIMKKIEAKIKKTPISRIEEMKHGYDIFFISKKDAASVASNMKHLNITVKKTYKLVGEKKGRKLYREYYSLR